MKKEVKKSEKFNNKDREFAVILEKIYNEIKVIAEGQAMLRDKLDSTQGMVAKNREDTVMLNLRTERIQGDIAKINGKLAQIEDDIRIIKTDFHKRLSHLETVK